LAAKATNLSTFAIAEMLHVDPGSVANWIDQGLLKAHRTPGGHRRVQVDDLIKFLREHKMPIPPELGQTPVRILVVDDEEAVAKLIGRAIRAQYPEYEVVEAHDGFRAGTMIATLRPDVVILDLRMPGMDGYEVCRMIKAQDSTRHAEVIAVTAFPSPESEKRIIECGARVCLSKPLDLEGLLKEVEKSL
jgi:excisionase family DNA binding protein